MDSQFDIIVVGAGPAGAITAERAARAGVKVLLLDRSSILGEPVRCGELIRTSSLRPFIETTGPWIVACFDDYRVVTPDGNHLSYFEKDLGRLLDRRIFDKELAKRAVDAGALFHTKANVLDVLWRDGKVAGVVADVDGHRVSIAARVVIAADGVASRVARMAGFDTSLNVSEVAATIHVSLTHSALHEAHCELHFGQTVAPGGYLWLFPKGDGTANLGLGIDMRLSHGQTPISYLNRFVQQRFAGGMLSKPIAGGIPISLPHREFVRDGFMMVGDAARQVNPLTGAGLFTAMNAGAMCGAVAAAAVIHGDTSRTALAPYEQAWWDRFGDFHRSSLKVRHALNQTSDELLNRAGQIIKPATSDFSVAGSIMELAEIATMLSAENKRTADCFAVV